MELRFAWELVEAGPERRGRSSGVERDGGGREGKEGTNKRSDSLLPTGWLLVQRSGWETLRRRTKLESTAPPPSTLSGLSWFSMIATSLAPTVGTPISLSSS